MSESCLTPYRDEIACLLPLVGREVLGRRYGVVGRTVEEFARAHGLPRMTPGYSGGSVLDPYFDELEVLLPIFGATRWLAARYYVSRSAILYWAGSRGVKKCPGGVTCVWNERQQRWTFPPQGWDQE